MPPARGSSSGPWGAGQVELDEAFELASGAGHFGQGGLAPHGVLVLLPGQGLQQDVLLVFRWNQQLTGRALDGLGAIGGITIYGPRDPARRTSLVAFNLAGRDPVGVAQALNRAGVESRASHVADVR